MILRHYAPDSSSLRWVLLAGQESSIHSKLKCLWTDRPDSWVIKDPERLGMRPPYVSPWQSNPRNESLLCGGAISSYFDKWLDLSIQTIDLVMVRKKSTFSESGPLVCLNFLFQLCRLAWVIIADIGYSPLSSSVPSFLFIELILFRCWVAKNLRPAASPKGNESGSGQASCNNCQPISSWLRNRHEKQFWPKRREEKYVEGLLRWLLAS